MKDYMNISPKHKNVVVIASHQRDHILSSNLEILSQNNNISNIVVSITNKNEIIVKNNKITYCYTRNQPLGEKWHHGLLVSKIFYPKYISILGSDDYIFNDYFTNILNQYTDFDLYLHNNWIMVNLKSNKFYHVKYKSNDNGLGSGRIINTNFLDNINWLFYPIKQSASLDNYSNMVVNNNKGKIVIGNNNDCIILSPKYNIKCMNSLKDIINKGQFDIEEITCNNKYISQYYDKIKSSFKKDYTLYSIKKYYIRNIYNIDLNTDNILVTTSLTYMKIINNNVHLFIDKFIGTPGIFFTCPFIKPNKYYKLYVEHNNKYSLFMFITNKDKDNYITYNKIPIKNNIAYFDTYDIGLYNRIAIITSTPNIGIAKYYKITVYEIEYGSK
jgi:hypothetical protein